MEHRLDQVAAVEPVHFSLFFQCILCDVETGQQVQSAQLPHGDFLNPALPEPAGATPFIFFFFLTNCFVFRFHASSDFSRARRPQLR